MSRARFVALIFIGFVVLVGGIMLAISLLMGDDTESIDPTPDPAPSSAGRIGRAA